MSDKIERYNDIAIELAKFAPIFAKGDDHDAELEAAKTIRTLRQIIERLRRIVDDGEPNEDTEDARIYRMVDVWKLPKDVLAKVMWEFLWHKSEDGECPAQYCKDYPCQFKHERKEELAENLANGDLDKETYDKYMSEINDDMYECDYGEGCWASYYAWCYLNGYNPLNGEEGGEMIDKTQTKTCKTCKYYARAGKYTVCCRDEVKILLYPEKYKAAYYMTKANSHCDAWKSKEAK